MIPWASLCPMPLWIRFWWNDTMGQFMPHAPLDQVSWFFQFQLFDFDSHLPVLSFSPSSFLHFLPTPHLAFTDPLTHCFTNSPSVSLTSPLTLPVYHQTLSIYLSCRAGLCTQHLISLSSSSSSVLRDLSLSVHCITTPLDCSPSHPSITSPSSSYLYLPQFVPLICPSRKLFFIVGLQPSPLDVPWQNTAYSSPLALTAYHVYTVDGTPPPPPFTQIYFHT